MNIQRAQTREDISKCWDVLLALRPHLQHDTFVDRVWEMLGEGYHLAFIEEGGKAVAAIGYRFQNFLFNGKHIYIDDLSTLPEYRGRGFAAALLDYVDEQARAKGLNVVALDSGYQRTDAHRLYLNKGFTMICHHFQKNLQPK
ncbi:GNAT family N-acetyltransferase [Ohtaekwangia sp.]|uniref:GNAT family N-acetyltransferase n=1 Tax=Ohtaekwangia sp. TaxID=2066019 RepID=UPI002F922D1A